MSFLPFVESIDILRTKIIQISSLPTYTDVLIEKSNQVRLAATGALNRSKVAQDMARQSLSNSNQAIQGQQRDSFENYIKTSRKAFNQAVEFHSQVEDIVHPILMQLDQLDGTLKELAQDFILSNEDILNKAKKVLKTLSHEAESADTKSIFAFNASKECLMTHDTGDA